MSGYTVLIMSRRPILYLDKRYTVTNMGRSLLYGKFLVNG